MLKVTLLDDKSQIISGLTTIIKWEEPQGVMETDIIDEDITDEPDISGSFIINNVLKFMEDNYYKHLMLSDVAEAVYISRWYLSKLLKKHTGRSFSETLNLIRVANAKRLLKNPALRICDISEMCGFSDSAHFSKIFKKYVGVSASRYRNSLKV